jgi:hypothetical protein
LLIARQAVGLQPGDQASCLAHLSQDTVWRAPLLVFQPKLVESGGD